jgi:hypothetical protein
MRLIQTILLAAAAFSTAACARRGKTAALQPPPTPPPAVTLAPPPAPPKLSVVQTNVTLPPPQPFDPEALATAPPEEPAGTPAPPRPVSRRPTPPAQRTEPPVQTAAPTPPEQLPDRGPVQEIVPAAEQKQLLDHAAEKQRAARQILDQMKGQRLSSAQKNLQSSVEQFLKLSEDAERRNDARGADALAERALVLARELQGAK